MRRCSRGSRRLRSNSWRAAPRPCRSPRERCSSSEACAIRELLERNLVPFSWHDIDTDPESQVLLDRLGIGADECPVLVRTHSVLRCPTVTQVADEFGLRAKVDQRTFDVVVLGAGP